MMSANSQLNLMIWNARSIRKKSHEFLYFMRSRSIDISLISETHLSSELSCSYPEYFTYRLDRPDDGKGGGVAIFIKRNIRHKLLPCPQTEVIEAIGVEVYHKHKVFTIFAVYFPGSKNAATTSKFKRDLEILSRGPNFLIGGDFNAKSVSWNCFVNNSAGRALQQMTVSEDMLIHFPDSHTHFPDNGNRPSTIDLILTRGIVSPSKPVTDDSFTSDHLPVLFSMDLSLNRTSTTGTFVKDFSRADWNGYRKFISSNISKNSIDLIQSDITEEKIDAAVTNFVELISEADQKFVPVKKKSSNHTGITDEIKYLIAVRRAKLRKFRRCHDPKLKIQIKTISEQIEFKTNKEINQKFGDAISEIDANPGPNRKKFWKITKFLKNRPKAIPALVNDNVRLITDKEKCDAFANHFQQVHEATSTTLGRDITSKKVKASMAQIESAVIEPHSIPAVTIVRLLAIIASLKNTKAPGSDNVNNQHLKQLPIVAVESLHNILNACLRIGYFPRTWKISKLRCVCKPGKKPTSVNSYRPISLLSSISKILERIMLDDMNDHIEANNIILQQQFGFRPGKSCTHQLYRITKHIRSLITRRKSVGMLCIDLKAAFDSVWHEGLLHKMHLLGFPTYLTKITKSFLQDRHFRVSIGQTHSSEFKINAGVPQGAVTSPTLFNIFLSDIPTQLNTMLAQFADDTAVLASSHSTNAVTNKLQKSANTLAQFFKKWRIRINGQKSEIILFTRKRAARHRPRKSIRVDGTQVNWKNEIKYLGLMLDPQLKFDVHIDSILSKCNRLIHWLYPLISRNSKLSIKNKLLLFKSIFRPSMTYAAPVWMNCAMSHKKKLQVLQNKVLKMMLGKPRHTPTAEIHRTTGVDMFQTCLEKLENNFIDGCRSSAIAEINSLINASLA